MDDGAEYINLTSLHDNSGSRPDPARTTNFLPINFQEFLTRPINSTNPQRRTTTIHGSYTSSESPPPPATTLSLNPCPGHPFSFPLGPNHFYQAQPGFPSGPDSFSTVDPFDGLASSSSCLTLPDFGRKRSQEEENSSAGDRRNKRMIKNRESAARSRARKQAYTNELEMEVAQLTAENAKLKEQQQLYLAAASQVSKKHGFHRSSTAPF